MAPTAPEWEFRQKSFLYQELSKTVLVWHATCIRRGQKYQSSGNSNQKDGERPGRNRVFGHSRLATEHRSLITERVMQQTEVNAGRSGAGRKRVQAVVETLASLGCESESVAEVAHDARNMVTALGLYCDLLEEPGVLAAPFTRYGNELRLVAAASRRLVEKLVALDSNHASSIDSDSEENVHTQLNKSACAHIDAKAVPTFSTLQDSWTDRSLRDHSSSPLNARLDTTSVERAVSRTMERIAGRSRAAAAPVRWDLMPAVPIENMALELLANHNLLAALAGAGIAVTVDVSGADKAVRLTGEDLTRVLVNLVKNAAEAMPNGGSIHISLSELPAVEGAQDALQLTIEDSGAGIPAESLESIFASGYTTRAKGSANGGSWAAAHRGLGLAITRSIVEAAGGRVRLTSQAPAGARFEVELPLRKTRP